MQDMEEYKKTKEVRQPSREHRRKEGEKGGEGGDATISSHSDNEEVKEREAHVAENNVLGAKYLIGKQEEVERLLTYLSHILLINGGHIIESH